ncbi:unnamed protein product [Sphagnum tenellum]
MLLEHVVYNDCFYRNVRRFEFVSMLDLDEVIVPIKRSSFRGCDYLVFRGALFLDNMAAGGEKAQSIPVNLNKKHIVRSKHFERHGEHSKCWFNTKTTVIVFNHHPIECSRKCSPCFVHEDLNHYRSDCTFDISSPPGMHSVRLFDYYTLESIPRITTAAQRRKSRCCNDCMAVRMMRSMVGGRAQPIYLAHPSCRQWALQQQQLSTTNADHYLLRCTYRQLYSAKTRREIAALPHSFAFHVVRLFASQGWQKARKEYLRHVCKRPQCVQSGNPGDEERVEEFAIVLLLAQCFTCGEGESEGRRKAGVKLSYPDQLSTRMPANPAKACQAREPSAQFRACAALSGLTPRACMENIDEAFGVLCLRQEGQRQHFVIFLNKHETDPPPPLPSPGEQQHGKFMYVASREGGRPSSCT